jgi:hypothetical protein
MKELSEPHDSWWKSKRPLPLGGRVPDNETLAIMQTLSEPKDLRESVISGLDKLFSGKKFREKVLASPQIALRPLFCPEEVNLQSDLTPLESERADVVVPTDFFIDQRLLSTNHMLHIAKTDYMEGLRTLGSKFPEIHALDGDHAWLSPVKATSDILAVAKLVEEGLIEDKLVLDVLGVDMTRPVFSKKRCELLQLVPDQWSLDWKDDFQKNLKLSRSEYTKILLQNMAEEPNGMQKNVDSFMESCHGQLSNNSSMLALVRYLDQTRKEIASSEISKNRNGQILEPGFRVIFPKFEKSAEVAWGRTLNESCQPK